MPSLINAAALFQSIITILFGAALTYYATRYWKAWETRKKTQDDIVAALKVRNDAADAERQALHADSATNKEQHTRFQRATEDLAESLRSVNARLQQVELESAGRKERDAATKDTLARIDGQLTRLVDNFLSRH